MIATPVLEPLIVGPSEHFTCYYKNETGNLQIIRISNDPNSYFERVVFPSQQLIFNSTAKSVLEIYYSGMTTTLLVERVPCEQLQAEALSNAHPNVVTA